MAQKCQRKVAIADTLESLVSIQRLLKSEHIPSNFQLRTDARDQTCYWLFTDVLFAPRARAIVAQFQGAHQ